MLIMDNSDQYFSSVRLIFRAMIATTTQVKHLSALTKICYRLLIKTIFYLFHLVILINVIKN